MVGFSLSEATLNCSTLDTATINTTADDSHGPYYQARYVLIPVASCLNIPNCEFATRLCVGSVVGGMTIFQYYMEISMREKETAQQELGIKGTSLRANNNHQRQLDLSDKNSSLSRLFLWSHTQSPTTLKSQYSDIAHTPP